jgi:hypothetical protein
VSRRRSHTAKNHVRRLLPRGLCLIGRGLRP